jgi:hypothetical protein
VFPLNLYARVRFCYLICTRDRGCSAHPVFAAPSVFSGGATKHNPGAFSAAGIFLLFEMDRKVRGHLAYPPLEGEGRLAT